MGPNIYSQGIWKTRVHETQQTNLDPLIFRVWGGCPSGKDGDTFSSFPRGCRPKDDDSLTYLDVPGS